MSPERQGYEYSESCSLRTMNKSDLDFSYMTSRVAVMSFPAEGVESAIKHHIDDVRAFLDNRHPNSYAVYNLSQRSYRVIKFQNRVTIIIRNRIVPAE